MYFVRNLSSRCPASFLFIITLVSCEPGATGSKDSQSKRPAKEKSREAGEPVVGKLEFSAFVQHSESVANGVPMGQIVFRRPTKNFFLMVNEASLPEGIEINCDGLQYIVWELRSVGYTLSETSG